MLHDLEIAAYEVITEQNTKKLEEDAGFDAGFKLPDTKSILNRLYSAYKEELRREHKLESEEMEKTGRNNKKRQRQGGAICCCEDPNCRIGPFIEKA